MSVRSIGVGVLLAVVVAGCASGGRLRYETPQEAYEKGLELYERGKYERAIQYLQGTFDFGRAHEWAADAQLTLARAYRDNKQFILAANEYTRFSEIYRTDPRVPLAEYERALTYGERSPDRELDQTDTERAIQAFNLFLDRFPQHELAPQAAQKVGELREKLARKQFETAQLYERRELYEAAAFYFETVFDKYPDTRWADDALLGAIRSYINFSEQSVRTRQSERLQKAVEHYQRLVQIFPDSPLLKDAEALYERANGRLQDLAENS